ncbi:MAG: hypothetical protein JXA23_08155 [Bacteroidales bacterium]|nr:hypothetical protein [Bacteroidales bacterium]
MYNLVQHKHLSIEKWQTYSQSQQILMISNEMNRALNALKSGHFRDAGMSYERAMELTDLTVEDERWESGIRELLRFREVLSELYLENDIQLAEQANKVLLTLNVMAWNLLQAGNSSGE